MQLLHFRIGLAEPRNQYHHFSSHGFFVIDGGSITFEYDKRNASFIKNLLQFILSEAVPDVGRFLLELSFSPCVVRVCFRDKWCYKTEDCLLTGFFVQSIKINLIPRDVFYRVELGLPDQF